MTTSGTWLNFMCHNLGANESLDPFVWNAAGIPSVDKDSTSYDIKGWLFQWGRRADGHQWRSSPFAANSAAPTTLDNYNQNPGSYTSFYKNHASSYDWMNITTSTSATDDYKKRWGDGTANVDQPKGANDPCPPGWKVPSQAQWGSIFRGSTTNGSPSDATANTWQWTTSGFKVGDALFLPAAGSRGYSTGTLSYVGSGGYYWSSTWYSGTNSHSLAFSSSYISPGYSSYRAYGFCVRCVTD
jgi:uncharacterized protein (TIGR02145 family)